MTGRWLFVLLVGSQGLMAAEPGRIEIFTTARAPIAAASIASVQIYNLDKPARIEAHLSSGLPRDPGAVHAYAERAVHTAWREQGRELTEAYQGLFKARQYGLDKLPAIVFDGKAVVYGMTDIEAALQAFRRWQESKP